MAPIDQQLARSHDFSEALLAAFAKGLGCQFANPDVNHWIEAQAASGLAVASEVRCSPQTSHWRPSRKL